MLESQVGMGTTVTLLLPRSRAQPSEAPAAPDVSDAGRGLPKRRHILLVEDDVEVAALTREMLVDLGFAVIHASSPTAALGALANARGVDVVLSDVMMPGGMSGLELGREIRRRHPRLPIVLTTGYSEAAADMQAGEFELLLKPYDAEGLWKALSGQPEDAAA